VAQVAYEFAPDWLSRAENLRLRQVMVEQFGRSRKNLIATLKLVIVTPDKLSYQGEEGSVVLPASEEEIGVLPMRLPLISQIKLFA
jgi:hypothetical protein